MTTTRDTSAIAEQTAWADDPGTAPGRRTDAPRTVEPGDSPSNPAAVHGIVGTSLSLRRVVRLVEIVAATDAAVLIRASRTRRDRGLRRRAGRNGVGRAVQRLE